MRGSPGFHPCVSVCVCLSPVLILTLFHLVARLYTITVVWGDLATLPPVLYAEGWGHSSNGLDKASVLMGLMVQ